MNNKICAIVVTYNRKDMLEENIDALLKQEYNNFTIIIIDNNSNDGTDEIVKKYTNEKIIYIKLKKNIGGAGGFNYGIRKAIEEKYDYCWIMDDDTIPNKSALKSLIKKKQYLKDEFSFICSKVEWIDGSFCKMNQPAIDKNWVNRIEQIKNNLLPVATCSFVSCFINIKEMGRYRITNKRIFYIW